MLCGLVPCCPWRQAPTESGGRPEVYCLCGRPDVTLADVRYVGSLVCTCSLRGPKAWLCASLISESNGEVIEQFLILELNLCQLNSVKSTASPILLYPRIIRRVQLRIGLHCAFCVAKRSLSAPAFITYAWRWVARWKRSNPIQSPLRNVYPPCITMLRVQNPRRKPSPLGLRS